MLKTLRRSPTVCSCSWSETFDDDLPALSRVEAHVTPEQAAVVRDAYEAEKRLRYAAGGIMRLYYDAQNNEVSDPGYTPQFFQPELIGGVGDVGAWVSRFRADPKGNYAHGDLYWNANSITFGPFVAAQGTIECWQVDNRIGNRHRFMASGGHAVEAGGLLVLAPHTLAVEIGMNRSPIPAASICPAHAALGDTPTRRDTVIDEDRRVGTTLLIAQSVFGAIQPEYYRWTYSGTGATRLLSVSFVGIAVSGARKNQIQGACDTQFGPGKVVVS